MGMRRAGRHGESLHRLQILQHVLDAPRGGVVAGRELAHEFLKDTGIRPPAGERLGMKAASTPPASASFTASATA